VKKKVVFFLSVLFLVSSITMPLFSAPGMIEYPCRVVSDGGEINCLGWNADCLCVIMLYY